MNLLIREKEIVVCSDRPVSTQYFATKEQFSELLHYPEKAFELRQVIGSDFVLGCVTDTGDPDTLVETLLHVQGDAMEECNQKGGVFNVPCGNAG